MFAVLFYHGGQIVLGTALLLEAAQKANLPGVIDVVEGDTKNRSRPFSYDGRIFRVRNNCDQLAVLPVKEFAALLPLSRGGRTGHCEEVASLYRE